MFGRKPRCQERMWGGLGSETQNPCQIIPNKNPEKINPFVTYKPFATYSRPLLGRTLTISSRALSTFSHLPFFFFSYVISVFGMAVFMYITIKGAWDFSYILFKSYEVGASIKSPVFFDYIFLPSIFTIFGIFIFLLSLWWIRISLKSTNKKISGLSGIVELLIYLSIYITIFPLTLIYTN